MTAMITQVFL